MSVTGRCGRPPGIAKTGGRTRGTPNRASLEVAEKLAALGCDPIETLATIAMDTKTPLELRVRILSDLASYRYPKRKATDDFYEVGPPTVTIRPVVYPHLLPPSAEILFHKHSTVILCDRRFKVLVAGRREVGAGVIKNEDCLATVSTYIYFRNSIWTSYGELKFGRISAADLSKSVHWLLTVEEE